MAARYMRHRNFHFGNDPREYCISTRNFVVDEDVNSSGLNTGRLFQLYSSILSDALQVRVEWIKDSTDCWKFSTPLSKMRDRHLRRNIQPMVKVSFRLAIVVDASL